MERVSFVASIAVIQGMIVACYCRRRPKSGENAMQKVPIMANMYEVKMGETEKGEHQKISEPCYPLVVENVADSRVQVGGQYHRDVMNMLPLGIIILNRDFSVQYVNKKVQKELDLSLNAQPTRRLAEILRE